MSWSDAHSVSEKLASEAHEAVRLGDFNRAQALFLKAAEAEEQALRQVSPIDKPRTFAITAVSTVALWYKGGELSRSEATAHQVLAHADVVETFAVDQLRALLQTIWNTRAQTSAGVKFVPGQVEVSVRGGEVVKGGAPLDLIVDKVQTIQSLFYRTTEWLMHLPLRRGPAPKDIQETCRPWLFQGVAASYQFVVAIERPKQIDLFGERGLEPQLVASTFLSILENAVNDPGEGLGQIVPDPEYKATFLKLTRNLSPTGKVFSQMEVKAAGDARRVLLVPEARAAMSKTLRNEAPVDHQRLEPVEVKGILRAVHLDNDWIEVQDGLNQIKISDVGEALDDVIGPMVNRQVTVRAGKDRKKKLHFRDIEAEE